MTVSDDPGFGSGGPVANENSPAPTICPRCGGTLVPDLLPNDDSGNRRSGCSECGAWAWLDYGIPKVEGGYGAILIDPPWPYQQKLVGKARGGAKKHYETMTLDQIAGLHPEDFAASDCQLWLWTTNSHIHEALHLVQSWGAVYKTTATWVKEHFGLGYWLRGQPEHLLLATWGKPRSKLRGPRGATGLNFSTVIQEPKGRHSAKPEASYRMIEAMSEEPRLELFASSRRKGWIAWGDQLESSIQEALSV